jgi:hypothetical protein
MKTSNTNNNSKAKVTITLSKEFRSEVRKVVNNDTKVNEYTTKRDTESLTLVQNVLTEVITAKKDIVVPKTISDVNQHKYRLIKTSMKQVSDNSYYLTVLDIAFKYLNSGYTVNLKENKLSTLKKLLDVKPTKASVKKCNNNNDLEALIKDTLTKQKESKKEELKTKLPKNILDILSDLTPEQYSDLKHYLEA